MQMKLTFTKQRKTIFWFLLFVFQFVISTGVHSQVLIGAPADGITPQDYSILELLSHGKRGLRLPQMTTTERDAMTAQQSFSSTAKNQAKGLTIFNTTINCMEVWNGMQWIDMITAGFIASIDCAKITAAAAANVITQNEPVNIKTALSYTGKAGADILSNGYVLGSANGLNIVVDGDQVVSSLDNGSIDVEITGSANQAGDFSIPVSLGGSDCSVNVTSILPCTNPSGVAISSSPKAPAVDQPFTLTATIAGGTAPYSYIWERSIDKKNWTNISSGAASNTIFTYNTQEALAGTYHYQAKVWSDRCSQADAVVGITSVNVCTPISSVTIKASSGGGGAGTRITLTATINPKNATSVTYQWQRRIKGTWTNVKGATSSTLEVRIENNDDNDYRVVVSNDCTDPIISDPI